MIQITLFKDEIEWALTAAKDSHERWKQKPGHYNNSFNSHLVGKLGELAVEKFLKTYNQIECISHFRYPEDEGLCDMELRLSEITYRIAIKTWSINNWIDLGRCIVVNQMPYLKNKSDIIIWCILSSVASDISKNSSEVNVQIAGWSNFEDIEQSPQKYTGQGGMRKVHNYQLDLEKIRSMQSLNPIFKQ